MGKASEIWKEIKPKIGEMLVAVNDIETQAEKAQDEAYQHGYETAKHECEDCPKQAYTDAIRMEGYQKGLSDAWEAARKIWEYDITTLKEIFGKAMRMDCYTKFTASEAIEKLKAYEQKKQEEYHVGDEAIQHIKSNGLNPAYDEKVIILYDTGTDSHYVMYSDGLTAEVEDEDLVKKTGRHFPEIAEVLEKMREG